MELVDSTVSNNRCGIDETGNGGGIFAFGGTVTLVNSTVSGNRAGENGGGIGTTGRAVLTLIHTTVSDNQAGGRGGGIFGTNSNVILANSIVADSIDSDDCSGGPLTSLGHNLDSDGTCNLAAVGDQSATDPLLGPLDDNGGPTQTHALLADSSAIDAVAAGFCDEATDQRGVPRPQPAGGLCDIGALEVVMETTDLTCGDVVGPGAMIKLGVMIGPCDAGTNPALTLVGPITVDLNGLGVVCDELNPPAIGLKLAGKAVRVRNGSIDGCATGVRVAGRGEHVLKGISARGNSRDGIRIISDDNELHTSVAIDNGDGIDISGDSNLLTGNSATANADDGFDVDGDSNTLDANMATNNADEGFEIGGGGTKLNGNTARDNRQDGFDIKRDDNVLTNNTASANGDDGIEIDRDGNTLAGNSAIGNRDEGIRVRGKNNTIERNTALDNQDRDLRDTNRNCDNNTWENNTFQTRNRDCIQ